MLKPAPSQLKLFFYFSLVHFGLKLLNIKFGDNTCATYAAAPNFWKGFCVETRPVSTQTVFLLLLSPFWVETLNMKFGDNTRATYAAAPNFWKGFCVETRPVSTQTVFLLLLSPFWVETCSNQVCGQHLRNLRCRTQFFNKVLC